MKPYEALEYVSRTIMAEIESDGLQKIDDNFYDNMLNALNMDGDELANHFMRLITEQLTLLFAIRLTKVFEQTEVRSVTKKEKYVFQKYNEFRRAVKMFIYRLRSPTNNEKESDNMLVLFNTPVEPFIDSNLRSLGPFEKNDMAYIPAEDALVLSRYGIVEVLLGE
jgi:hypothetical protein